jgi:MFS transporter, SP family, arabinose:H+ symporter
LVIPESPRWLLAKKGDRQAGVTVLRLIEPNASEEKIATDADAILAASAQRGAAGKFWSPALRVPILLALLVAFFNQLSGINAILYFALAFSR